MSEGSCLKWLSEAMGHCFQRKVENHKIQDEEYIKSVYKNELELSEFPEVDKKVQRKRKSKKDKDDAKSKKVAKPDNQPASIEDQPSEAEGPKFRARFDHRVTDKYDIKALIGKGNFSRVVRVEHKQTHHPYAIKMIDKGGGRDVSEAELSVLQRVKHPYIIQLIEYFDSVDRVYLVVELATGGELFDRIISKGFYSEIEAANVLLMLLEGLRHLHRLGFVHRDLKPENLLYYHPGTDSKIMITDFGLSANFRGNGGALHTTCGTPEYIAPEILARQPYDSQVDMWSVGVITYILLSGTMPFDDETRPRLYRLILKAKFSFDGEPWPLISPVAKDFVDRLLRVDPRERIDASRALKHPWITQTALLHPSANARSRSSVPSNSHLSRRQSDRYSVKSGRSSRSTRSGRSVLSFRSDHHRRVMPEELDVLHNDPEVQAELSSLHSSRSGRSNSGNSRF